MEVTGTRIEKSPLRHGYSRVVASVGYDHGAPESEEYWFEFPEELAPNLEAWGDPWLVCLLPLAATLGEPLRISLPVDAILLGNMDRLQEIWRCWYPRLHPVRITARASSPRLADSRRTASFFSGGVDSFYTALKHRSDPADEIRQYAEEPLQDILCVWGFDIPLSNAAAFERVRSSLDQVGRDLGLRFHDIATNLRETRWNETDWPGLSHGAALAAVAHCVGAGYKKVFVPSTDSYCQLYPWGSHVLTDPLFTTSRTAIDHDGAEASRYGKISSIVRNDAALRSLRVCWRSQTDVNCGRCQKCCRTMLALELLGALERCPAFGGGGIDLGLVRRIYIEWDLVGDYEELRRKALALGRTDIARAIRYAFWRSKAVTICSKASHFLRGTPLGSTFGRLFGWLATSRTVT